MKIAVCSLLLVGGATVDFEPLTLYKAFQLSDGLLMLAGLVSLWSVECHRTRAMPTAGVFTVMRRNPSALAVAVAGLAFLAGGAISTILAGAPAAGIETWLHFALLILGVAPLVAIAVAREPAGVLWLAIGLVVGSAFEALGYVEQALTGAPLSGARLVGAFGSHPLYLLVVGLAVVGTHVAASASREGLGAVVRRRTTWLEVAVVILVLAALVVSRARSAWLAVLALPPLTVLIVVRRPWFAVLTLFALAATAVAAYQLEILPALVVERVQLAFDEDSPDTKARTEVMSTLLEHWRTKPWGLGIGESSGYLPAYLVQGGTGAVHNVVLHTLVEMGPISALAIVALPFALTWLWLSGYASQRRVDWRIAWPLVSVWALYLAAQATPTLHQHVAWIAVGALIGTSIARTRTTISRT